MHADLVKLLELQAKDAVLSDAEQRLAALNQNAAALDQALQRARESLEAAQKALAEGRRRRDEMEAKIESYRLLQDRRKQRLEQVKNAKEASAVMAELDLARAVMAKEESDWVRTADGVVQLEIRVQTEETNLKTIESSQAEERALLGQRRDALEVERAAALTEREASAATIDRPLRIRYDRLRRSRSNDVVVPLVGGACGGCHTAVPLNRRSQIKAGSVIDGCEACGAILYPPEPSRSA
ncbi:MAG: zinc ribbon domain-containing protein [Gemmatimonadales bacterium]